MTPSTLSILGYGASTVLLDNAILMLWSAAAVAIGYGIGRIHERFRADQPQALRGPEAPSNGKHLEPVLGVCKKYIVETAYCIQCGAVGSTIDSFSINLGCPVCGSFKVGSAGAGKWNPTRNRWERPV